MPLPRIYFNWPGLAQKLKRGEIRWTTRLHRKAPGLYEVWTTAGGKRRKTGLIIEIEEVRRVPLGESLRRYREHGFESEEALEAALKILNRRSRLPRWVYLHKIRVVGETGYENRGRENTR